MKFNYKWELSGGFPAKDVEPHKCKVFGTFICGGGSSMGYKLAGFEHLGGVEIDKNVADVYQKNLHPKYLFVEDLRDFNKRENLPDELYNLDLLDGSPPCSTFSMAGSREDAWGLEKKFSEGQKMQTLDDLVFVYAETIFKLKPKIFILENVKGLCQGNARSYIARLLKLFTENGYETQVFVLNAATMGVPQKRERTFIVGRRKDLCLNKLVLNFREKPILFKFIIDKSDVTNNLTEDENFAFCNRKYGDRNMAESKVRAGGKYSSFTRPYIYSDKVCPTITTTPGLLFDFPRKLNEDEIKRCSSFPLDYYAPQGKLLWLCGMSVPPVMTAQLSYQIYLQILKPYYEKEYAP